MAEAGDASIVPPEEDPLLAAFVRQFEQRFGARLLAVLAYGSYLRGKRDTVLDFYVLLDDYHALPGLAGLANRLLPPNVYFVTVGEGTARQAAKYATLTLDAFEHALDHDFHSYFWARFAQPYVVLMARDEATRARVARLGRRAARRMLRASLALMPEVFSATELWTTAFGRSYGAELRSEDRDAAARLHQAYADTLDAHLTALADEFALEALPDGRWRHTPTALAWRRVEHEWRARRALGKLLSVARLLKAAFTFNDPLDYVVWKVARHSGVVEVPSPRARRHPLLFGWGTLWRLYRRGGFR